MLTKGPGIIAPGVFSPIAAQLAEKAGSSCLYFSGGGFANLQGLPDLGVTTLSEVGGAARSITSLVDLPLIVDADTGFGEAVNVMRTVKEMEASGAAAIHIEDQVMPKRCGHLSGKELVSTEEMTKKIVAAKEASTTEMLLIARTDARAVEGFDAAVDRAHTYLRAGADMIFPEALETEEEFAEFAKKVSDAPLLANMTEFGKTPYLPAARFHSLGYKVVIFPMTAFRVMLKSVLQTYTELLGRGTQSSMLGKMMTREEIYELIDYRKYEAADARTLAKAKRILHSN
jgi:methylisocitrate lyase